MGIVYEIICFLQKMNNRKLVLYGSVCALLLIAVIAVFIVRLFSPSEGKHAGDESVGSKVFMAVPSDAVMLADVGALKNIRALAEDTVSFAYGLIDKNHILVDFGKKLADVSGAGECASLYSLHYSSKNDVSLLLSVDISPLLKEKSNGKSMLPFLKERKKRYNNTDIYVYDNALYVACYDNFIIASTSSYLIESSIRHLDNETSILDNAEFNELLLSHNGKNALYVNHHQIGKFFSGVMMRDFLKYSDFFLRFASWSFFDLKVEDGVLGLAGKLKDNKEEKYNSSVFYGQTPAKSSMGKILPAETVFAVSLSLSDLKCLTDSYLLFLEVHKKLSGYTYKQHIVGIKDKITPLEYVCDSLKIEEVVAAYCKFGERYEWLTFVKEKGSFGFAEMVSSVIDKEREIEVHPYIYKGYIESVLGEAFSHCNEEAYCKLDGWQVIGPKDIVSDFASGNANYTNLEYYLEQTKASDFLKSEGVVKIIANLQQGRDSVLNIVKPYYRNMIAKSLDYKNFGFVTVNIGNVGDVISADAGIYAVRMPKLPEPKPREEPTPVIYVDSTIVIDNSLFELKDFKTGGKCYLEQLPNGKLRMLNGKRKGVWTIPFEGKLCGAVAQVDFFKNGKLQMLLVAGDKLHLIDRLGRSVKGFPITLPQRVVYGPEAIDINNDKNYSFCVLNEDNSIAIYRLDRENIGKGIIINVPEFVKELPVLKSVNGKKYLFLKTVYRLRIYNTDGREVVIKDKKRAIAPDSKVVAVEGSEIKVTGLDGKEFIVDLASGKTKKL